MIDVSCPLCGANQLEKIFACKDYTVSHETFQLVQCPNCNLFITNPRPTEDTIGGYYQSTEYISHTNASKSILDKVYKLARTFTLKWKINLVKQYTKTNPSLLDFGCGTGNFLLQCLSNNIHVTGVEPSKEAKANADHRVQPFIKNSIQELPASNFDIITLWHVLEHLPEPVSTIKSLSTHLADNGTIFIAVPNHESYDAKFYKEYWAGYDVPRHYWHFNQSNIKKLADNCSLRIIETIPMKLDSYYVSLLSEKYKNPISKISNILKGFKLGLLSNISANKTSEYSSLLYILKKR